ncbi:MAG: hypothetical protein AB7T06_06335 [Kofleriaceae bacterium]
MQATDTSAIQRLIGQARSRIRMQWALEGATSGFILGTANALIAIWLMRVERVSMTTGVLLLVASALFVIGGALISALRHIDDEVLARKIDRASGLSDRLSTAIAFQRTLATGQHAADPDAAETEDLMVAAIKDGLRAVPRANVAAATPFTAPRDLKAAGGFLVLAALIAGLAIPRPDRLPALYRVDPDHARPGETLKLVGKNLTLGLASSGPSEAERGLSVDEALLQNKPYTGGWAPTDGSVYLGAGVDARPIQVLDWTKTMITVRVPDNAEPGDTHITVYIGKKAIGPLELTVVDLKDDKYKKEGAVLIDPEERAYIESILRQLKDVAKRDNVPELEEFATKLEQMLKDAEEGKITKEQLLEALQKAEEALSAKAEPNQAEINKAMQEMGKELSKENVTKELGKALEKNDLQKAKEELEKLANRLDPEEAKKELEELKKQLESSELTEQEKKDLQKKIDDLKKQLEDPKLTDKQKEELQKQIEELKKQMQDPKLTEQQKQELQKKMEQLEQQLENKDLTQQQKDQLKEQMKELQKQMENKQLTPQQKEELQKKMEALKNQKPMTEQEKQKLQEKLEQVAKQMEQKDQKQQQQMQQQQQKLEKQIRELQKKKDEAKTEKEKLDAERELQKKKDELQKLKKDEQDKKDSAQREALKRLQKDMEKAAEQLEKKPDPNKSKDERDEEEKERDRQASRNLKDAARETGRVDQDQRKQAAQKKMSSQMDDLREAMRRAKQKGNKGPQDPFGKGNKNKDFQARARGQKGSGQAWKPGQGKGQPGQGQPGGQGNQPGGKQWGTGTGPDLAGDPTNKSGNTKDEDLQGVSGKGSSRRETILSAAQKGFASTSYQKVYADYQKIVEEVMRNEKLPSSYKYYVKRYFAKIHPNTGNADTAPTAPQANKAD